MKIITTALLGLVGGAFSGLAEVKLLSPAGYLPGIPLLVRVEVCQPDGARDRELWDAEAELMADAAGITLSTNRLPLRNGLGSVLVAVAGGGDFTLTAKVCGQSASRTIRSLTNAAAVHVGGLLPGSHSTWNGLVRVTNTVTVPPGHQLTIETNTLVLLDGVEPGTAGPGLLVQGAVQSLGSELHPVTFTCADPALRWGQIRHENAEPSLYRHTSITRAGRAPPEGQTGQAPVVRASNSAIVFESCNLTDHAEMRRGAADYGTPGRILAASGSHVVLENCLLSRARMGLEALGGTLVLTNCQLAEMRGPNDADGLYLLSQTAGQQTRLWGCVLAGGDDDGIDTLSAFLTVEDCIIRDWDNRVEDAKGLSLLNGVTRLEHTLIVDCTTGLAAKWNVGPATLVSLDRCTLAGNLTNVLAQRRPNAPGPFIDCRITNSVLWGGDAVASDFGPTNFTVVYSDVSEPWPGAGNLLAPPLFVDQAAHNYHLLPGSPCVDAGDPAGPPDADQSRADIGAFPFELAAVPPVWVRIISPGDGAIFTAPTNILLEALAGSRTGSVERVEFYQDLTWVGEDTDPPFEVLWSNVSPGVYGLCAVAVDNEGGSATSRVVQVTVVPDPAPRVAAIEPPPGASVASFEAVSVWFTEPVTGVDGADLLVNFTAAGTVAGSGAGPYIFRFAQPLPGVVLLSWAVETGIRDGAGNLLAGSAWSYLLEPTGGGVMISEIMYHPGSGNPGEEYIELFNPGAARVDLGGWRFSAGVRFVFPPGTWIEPGGYLVVGADVASLTAQQLGLTNLVGNWEGRLSDRGEGIDLDDAMGRRVDRVRYADEGDWAERRRGDPSPLPGSPYRGWEWRKEHDGSGRSLELINPALPNEYGQNWTASVGVGGTPGRCNSTGGTNIAPIIAGVNHLPIVPKPSEEVIIAARVVDEQPVSLAVRVFHRPDANPPGAFSATPMFDDGGHGDGAAGDGIFGGVLPSQPQATVVEFYVEAVDGLGQVRTWPGPAWETNGVSLGQLVNALYQVDEGADPSDQPVYRLILTERERAELAAIGSGTFALWPAPPGTSQSDAQMNGTFVSVDGTGTECRYRVGIKNRGHATRNRKPNNFRVHFPSDAPWKGVVALNLNGQYSYAQVIGAALSQHAGVAGANSRAVQVRVNSTNLALGGSAPLPAYNLTYGSYAANEVLDADWAEGQFPLDPDGAAYQVVRDIASPSASLDYRGPDPQAYTNTYFQRFDGRGDAWTELIAMLRIMGSNDVFTTDNVRRVIDVEQWVRHLALMAILANAETGLNSGYNDDYTIYLGVADPRAILVYYDLDTILGEGNSIPAPTATIWGATTLHADGDSGAACSRFLHWPDFEPIYYQTLHRLLETTFSQPQFDALLDQTLGNWVPADVILRMKDWMNARRDHIQGLIATNGIPVAGPPRATVAGEPRSPSPLTWAALTVGGDGVSHYRFSLNDHGFGPEAPVAEPILLMGLAQGSTNAVLVIGRDNRALWQDPAHPTVSRRWVVDTNWPAVRVNEVLASNRAAVDHEGTHPDLVELYNEGAAPVDLAGMRLTDDLNEPDKFIIPPGTRLAVGACLVLCAGEPDGSPGLYLGFALNQEGDGVYLFDRADRGGALLDAVVFGRQVADCSIGRVGGAGEFVLTQPSLGAPNLPHALGDLRSLKVNEWLAAGQSPFPDDFIELFNPDPLPVALGGLHLTDAPIGAPKRHPIAPLSFVEGSGFALFRADGEPNQFGFRLASEQGWVALTGVDGSLIDQAFYGPQRRGVAEGRCPDGGWAVVALSTPTPGLHNACPWEPPPPPLLSLVVMSNLWNYDVSGADLGLSWTEPGYDDSGWRSGMGLFFEPPSRPYALPERVRTWVPPAIGIVTYRFRTRFIFPPDASLAGLRFSHVIDDGALFYLDGQEVGRFNLPEGSISNTTLAATVHDAVRVGPLMLTSAPLSPGEHVVAVEVHQDGLSSADVCFGLELEGVLAIHSPALAGVVLNEMLADNASFPQPDHATPDWVEIFNPSTNLVDLADMSLSDNPGEARSWVFPPGSLVPPHGFLIVLCDADQPASPVNTGFGLNSTGDMVCLFDRLADGGGLRDFIAFGLQLPDYSIGRFPDGSPNWGLQTVTPGTANATARTGALSDLKVNEWMAAPPPGQDDWFELYNAGTLPVSLGGLHLTDELDQTTKYPPIPALSFIGAGSNAFRKFVADGNLGAGAHHVAFALKASGEAAGVATAAGQLIDGVAFGPQLSGVSQGRLPDGDLSVVFLVGSASPGAPNYLAHATVVINEVLAGSPPNSGFEDAIELRNLGGQPVDISGWWLSDAGRTPCKYQVEPGTVLSPGGFKVFYEYQFNSPELAALPFALSSARGDEVWLSAVGADGLLNGYRAAASFGAVEDFVSLGRWETSIGAAFVPLSRRSFGVDQPASVEQFRTGQGLPNAAPRTGPAVINQVMYHPPGNDPALEFIELRNITTQPVPMFDPLHPANTWRLSDGVEFDFPPGATIPPCAGLVIVGFNPEEDWSSLALFQGAYGPDAALLGPWRGRLDNAGEGLELLRPLPLQPEQGTSYTLVDRVDYDEASPWPVAASGSGASLQKRDPPLFGNEPAHWLADAPGFGPRATADCDADGLPDVWELCQGLNPADPLDAFQDADGDGLTNLQEWASDTDPHDPSSCLRVTRLTLQNNLLTIEFPAMPGRAYAILCRGSLDSGAWRKLAEVLPSETFRTVAIPDHVAGPQQFYQVVTPAPPGTVLGRD